MKLLRSLVFNKEQKTSVEDLIFEKVKISNSNFPQIYNFYKVYRIRFGVGDESCFLITDVDKDIPLGINFLPLEFLRKFPFDEELKEKVNKNLKKENWDKYISERFFSLGRMLDDRSFEKIKGLNQDTLLKLIDMYLFENYSVDYRLKFLTRSLLVRFPENAQKSLIQHFQAHSVICTNSGTGKSTIFDRIGEKHERASIAGFLGFSTADSVAFGYLNGKTSPQILDEVQEEKGVDFFSQLLSFEESGNSRVTKGKKSIYIEGACPLVYISNPKYKAETASDLLEVFLFLYSKLTSNYEAFTRRKALILFGDDFEVSKGKNIDHEEHEKIGTIVKEIFSRIKQDVYELFLDRWVQGYLQKEHDKKYTELIAGMREESVSGIFSLVLDGLKSNFKHVRGLAFRLSIIEHLSALLNKKLSKKAFLVSLDENYERVMDVNIKSVARFVETFKTDMLVEFKVRIKTMKHKALKALLFLVYNAYKESKDEFMSFDALSFYTDKLPKEFSSYREFIWIERRLDSIDRFDVENYFGLSINKEKKLVHIKNKEVFEKFVDAMDELQTDIAENICSSNQIEGEKGGIPRPSYLSKSSKLSIDRYDKIDKYDSFRKGVKRYPKDIVENIYQKSDIKERRRKKRQEDFEEVKSEM